ncbi:MAG: hypothetical protein Fur0012_02500 [Elusimicrobiota bacterium]
MSQIIFSAACQSDISYFVTDSEGRFLFVNSAFEKSTGYRSDEVLGKTPSIIKSGKHNRDFYQNLWYSIKKGEKFKSRIINRRKDGSLYTVMLSIQPVEMQGNIKYYVGREENIENIIQLENKLIESQKMESLATMTGELAHNFNNLLTVIIGSMELISDDLKKDSPTHKLAGELLKSAREQTKIIRQLMVFSRKQSAEKKQTDINDMLKDLLPLIQSQVGARIKVLLEPSKDLRHCEIDDSLIKQAVLNLTSNARDAIENTGIITISTYNYSAYSEEKEPYHSGDYSVIEVKDSGCGIPESAIEHIFEPFYTTKPRGKGTGLGLSSVYGIIKNHGGYIYASNLSPKGASFRIYLPSLKK